MNASRKWMLGAALLAIGAAVQPALATTQKGATAKAVERGRYLVTIAGCNDCHTPGYRESGAKVPEKDWLTGDQLGWHGSWGTTYPSNLRLYMQTLTEAQWLKEVATKHFRPPMPSYALRAIYQFVRSLGPAGVEAPAYLAPGVTPKGPPVVVFPDGQQ